MEIITRTQLREARNSFEKGKSYNSLNDAVNESKTRKGSVEEVTVFLSHKHEEGEALKDAIALLKNRGVKVYVDWLDEDMPKQTSGQTATKIKARIRDNKKFILLATEKAIASKWCNWELGLGDAAKYINNIALLPIRNDNENYSGSEYLQIYPVIGRKYSWSENYYEVQFPNKAVIDLDDWLKR